MDVTLILVRKFVVMNLYILRKYLFAFYCIYIWTVILVARKFFSILVRELWTPWNPVFAVTFYLRYLDLHYYTPDIMRNLLFAVQQVYKIIVTNSHFKVYFQFFIYLFLAEYAYVSNQCGKEWYCEEEPGGFRYSCLPACTDYKK